MDACAPVSKIHPIFILPIFMTLQGLSATSRLTSSDFTVTGVDTLLTLGLAAWLVLPGILD